MSLHMFKGSRKHSTTRLSDTSVKTREDCSLCSLYHLVSNESYLHSRFAAGNDCEYEQLHHSCVLNFRFLNKQNFD